jgi:hypothetical protein
MDELRNSYCILGGKSDRKTPVRRPKIDVSMTLESTLKK